MVRRFSFIAVSGVVVCCMTFLEITRTKSEYYLILPTKMSKKSFKVTPFTLYMKFRKPQLESKGKCFPGGWKDVAQCISDEWRSMPDKDRAVWRNRAIRCKEQDRSRSSGKHGSTAIPSTSSLGLSSSSSFGNYAVCLPQDTQGNDRNILLEYLTTGDTSVELMVFPVVHFNVYSGLIGGMFLPSEYCVGLFSIKDGIQECHGSLIDPGPVPINTGSMFEAKEESNKLSIPMPNYHNTPGKFYGTGNMRYEDILKKIMDAAIVMKDVAAGKTFYVLFTVKRNDYMLELTGCINWLLQKCNQEFNYRIFHLPTLVRLLASEGHKRDTTKPNFRNDAEVSAILYVTTLDFKIQIGCDWHYREENSGFVNNCATNIVKRSIFYSLTALTPIFDIKPEISKHIPDLTTKREIIPLDEEICHLEFRQRFGLVSIDMDIQAILQRRFIHPEFFTKLKSKFPKGLPKQPKVIFWPASRDIERDLNYACGSLLKIKDPNPKGIESEPQVLILKRVMEMESDMSQQNNSKVFKTE